MNCFLTILDLLLNSTATIIIGILLTLKLILPQIKAFTNGWMEISKWKNFELDLKGFKISTTDQQLNFSNIFPNMPHNINPFEEISNAVTAEIEETIIKRLEKLPKNNAYDIKQIIIILIKLQARQSLDLFLLKISKDIFPYSEEILNFINKNPAGFTEENIKKIYENWDQLDEVSGKLKDFKFDEWISFLMTWHLVKRNQEDKYYITLMGREYLRFRIDNPSL